MLRIFSTDKVSNEIYYLRNIILLLIFAYLLPQYQDYVNKKNPNINFYIANQDEIIIFSSKSLPSSIKFIKGFSFSENWGRWTEHAESKDAIIKFSDPLPNKFRMDLKLRRPLGKSQEIKISIGDNTQNITLDQDEISYRLQFDHIPYGSNTISFTPEYITQPGVSDARKIGFGFISVKITSNN